MVPHEGCDEVVAVVVGRLHPHCAGVSNGSSGRSEIFGLQLNFQKSVSRSLVNEDGRHRSGIFLDQFRCIVFLASFDGAQVSSEGLLSPWNYCGVTDGGKCRAAAIFTRILEMADHGTVPSHGVASD